MDCLIKNGTIIDGKGSAPKELDVLISRDKIVEIGRIEESDRYLTIKAKEMIVCPGFIDVNNHSDTYWTIFEYPGGESLITQGITTVIGGNCGSSLAPLLSEDAIKSIQKYIDISKTHVEWARFKEFLDFLEGRQFNPNFGSLVGHSTLRRAFTGDEMRQLRDEELSVMTNALDDAMQEGALGMSTGLIYSHAVITPVEEIIKLAEVIKKNNGVYATHVRGEGQNLVKSVEEAISIAKRTGVSLQISHLKACGKKNWPLQERALELIEIAKEEGIDVNFDVYPYREAGPVLYTLLPSWVAEGGKEALMNRLRKPQTKAKVIEEMRQNDLDYGEIVIGISKLNQPLTRHKVARIAGNQGRGNEEVVIDLILASEDVVTTIVELMSAKNVEQTVKHKLSMVASNGVGYSLNYQDRGNLVHPRCFGAFPRFLKEYVFENKILELEEAIRKITGLPAQKYGLEDRGVLEKGKKADVVVFNPKEITDKATVVNPFRFSKGVKDLIINGEMVISDYVITGTKKGKTVKKA